MSETILVQKKKSGDTLTADEFNEVVEKTNLAIKKLSGYPEIISLTYPEYENLVNTGQLQSNKRYRVIN
ncbi:MAG: hypothetical protein RBU23_12980 [Candidatus Auribacterota bacterium]|jgi:hypothetical protein|nr:hypothetical protein [Candidatus Auribacterota bacterium]